MLLQINNKFTQAKLKSSLIDDVISINNSKFGDYVDQIKATEIEKNDTTNTATYVSYHCHTPRN
jgi:hypothetical protein